MHGRLAVELCGNCLLNEVFPFDDAAQNCFDDFVAALVGRHVGEAELIVDLLLRYLVGADMSDDLSDDRLGILLLAAASECDHGGQSAYRCRDTPAAG